MHSIYCKVCDRRQPTEVSTDFSGTVRTKCRRCDRWLTVRFLDGKPVAQPEADLKLVGRVKAVR